MELSVGPVVSVVLAIILLLVLIVLIRFQIVVEIKLREKDIETIEGMRESLSSLSSTGEPILILCADDPLWGGRSESIRVLLLEAIAACRRLGIMNEGILPLRIGVSGKLAVTHAAVHLYAALVVFRAESLSRTAAEIDETIAHEVAHFLDANLNWHHNPDWEEMYRDILGEMVRARKEKQT